MTNLKIDNKPISDLNLDELGATMQLLAEELAARDFITASVAVRGHGDIIRKFWNRGGR